MSTETWLSLGSLIALAVIVLLVVWSRARRHRRLGAQVSAWAIAEGRIVSSIVGSQMVESHQPRPDGGVNQVASQQYYPDVTYAFSIGEQTYAGHTLTARELDGRELGRKGWATARVARFRTGDTVYVRYDPFDPHRNCLDYTQPRGERRWFAHTALTSLGVALILFAVYQLMIVPVAQLVSGSNQHEGSAVLELHAADRVTVFTMSPNRAAAPACSLDGPGSVGSADVVSTVYDLSGYRFYPTHGFSVDVTGEYTVACVDGAPFLTEVRPGSFGLRMIVTGQVPALASVLCILVAVLLFVVGDAFKKRAV